MTRRRAISRLAGSGLLAIVMAGCAVGGNPVITDANAQNLPPIRLTVRNRVPACVTPVRMMRFLVENNPDLAPKFRQIAWYYKTHGERLGVRWDYAFFQMVIETNYLKFRNNSGKGDVSPRQNNFAGIGTTGGGVPGDSFPDVSTGVLAQFQHLVAYSGERVANPVARRTREKQDDIIARSRRTGRPVTFRDLAGRWAADRRYARSISFIASRYAQRYCTSRAPVEEADARFPPPASLASVEAPRRPQAPTARPADTGRPAAMAMASGLGGASVAMAPGLVTPPARAYRPATCKVFTASYGGEPNVLIRHRVGNVMHYTALQVIPGRERQLAESFIRTHAPGGEAIAQYSDREHALSEAFALCPSAAGHRG
jgi:hypothetical protein